jgi:hypothetical protein
MRNTLILSAAAVVLLGGCNMKVKEEGKDGNKNVSISSSLGDLKVRTDEVNPADTGLSVYPGSRLKPNDDKNHDNKADVNINTPWFGVKVVALTYESDADPEKIWGYYRDEMTKKWGNPLQCRPGSPDMDKKKEGKNDLDCREESNNKHGVHIDADTSEMQLKVGSEDKQHVVAVKKEGGKTQYSLVYVTVRGEKDSI